MDKQLDIWEPFEDEGEDEDFPVNDIARLLDRIVLSGSDWTTETLLNQLKRGNIILNPGFQRRDAWNVRRKSRFIESLILNFPVPQIVLAESREARGQYLVLDGKQRLTTLLQFVGASEAADITNGFSLAQLEVLKELNGYTFSDLESNATKSQFLNAFLNETVRTVVIKNWSKDELLHMIFVRLNTGSVELSPQELRQALYPGEFSKYVDQKSGSIRSLQALLNINQPDFRMRDVEILIRYLGFHSFLGSYTGNMSGFLDFTTKQKSEEFSRDNVSVENDVKTFESALDAAIEIFGNAGVARKWNGNQYESRTNRAILDVLLYYFSDSLVREESLERSEEIVSAYKGLFTSNTGFRESVESTTKSLQATFTRLRLWGVALEIVLNTEVPVVTWDEANRRILPKPSQA